MKLDNKYYNLRIQQSIFTYEICIRFLLTQESWRKRSTGTSVRSPVEDDERMRAGHW